MPPRHRSSLLLHGLHDGRAADTRPPALDGSRCRIRPATRTDHLRAARPGAPRPGSGRRSGARALPRRCRAGGGRHAAGRAAECAGAGRGGGAGGATLQSSWAWPGTWQPNPSMWPLIYSEGNHLSSHLWWQRNVSFWNSLCDLPDDDLHRQVAMDDILDANTRHVRNWAWSFRYNLREIGYESASTGLLPVCLKTVLQLLDGPTAQLWNTLDIIPRTCPSQDATLCTYLRWFTKPSGLSRSVSLLLLPLSARCLRILLRFRMGCHSLPIVCGRRSGIPRPQRLCPHCASHAVGDERHKVFECEALLTTRENFADFFGPAIVTRQQFMWQGDLVQVAHFVSGCLAVLETSGDD